MAKKATIKTITSGYASNTQLNFNFEAINDALDNTLSLDGSAPNAMGADLDLNNNDLLNGGVLNGSDIVVAGTSLATQVTAAADSATAAALSETNAATSETNAAGSAASAAASFDEFDDIYLGVFIVDPTLDNDGDPLQEGATYFNSVTTEWKIYVSSAWVVGLATGSGSLLAANNLSDVDSAATSRTNLNVDVAGTDNSTDVTLVGTPDYITIVGQVITRNQVDLIADVSGILPSGNLPAATTTAIGAVEKATTAEGTTPVADKYPDTVGVDAMITERASGSLEFIATIDLTLDATADFTGFDATKYDSYKFVLTNVIPSDAGTHIWVRTSTDGGSTYDAGASNYDASRITIVRLGTATGSGAADTKIAVTATVGMNSGAGDDGISGELMVYGPHLAKETNMTWNVSYTPNSGDYASCFGGGQRQSSADVDALRFLSSFGTLESGTITMYGMKNA